MARGEDLIEREHELSTIDAALERARAGAGSLVLIQGPPGAGITRLLAAAVSRARQASMIIGDGRATVASPTVPLGVARQLFGAAMEQAADRSDILLAGPAARAGPWLEGAAVDEIGEPELIEGLGELAGRLAREAPALLLAVDDLHLSDPASVRVLLAIAPWIGELPIAIVAGLHQGAVRREHVEVDQLLGLRAAHHLAPAPLSLAGVTALVAQRFGSDAPPALGSVCMELTAGNPGLMADVVDALEEQGTNPITADAAALTVEVPGTVRRRVRAVLSCLNDGAHSLAGALAILGAPATLSFAAAVAELDPQAAELHADALATAGLIGESEPLAFRQPLVAAAVAAEIPAFASARLHRRALDLLRTAGGPPECLAPHLLHVAPGADPAVVEALRAAASTASAAGARRRAVEFLRRALDEPPSADVYGDVVAELAMAESVAGDERGVARLEQALEHSGTAVERGRLFVGLGRLRLARGEYPEAVAVVSQGLEELDPSDPLAEQLLSVHMVASGLHPPLVPGAMQRAAPLFEAAYAGRLPTDPGLCAWLAAVMAALGAPIETVRALVDRALHESPLVDDSHASIYSFVRTALLNIDDVERAEETATAAMIRAGELGLRIAHDLAQHGRALARYRAGRLDEALADGEASLLLREAGWTFHAAYDAAMLVAIRVERNELDRAREALEIGHEHATRGMLERAHVLHAQAIVEMAEADPRAALRSLLAAGEALDQLGMVQMSPRFLPWASAAAIAAAAAGDADRARELAGSELELARATELPGIIGVALRGAGHAADGERRIELLSEAVDELARSPARLEHARALVDLGTAIRSAGRPKDAREPLADGLHLADQCGARATADRARDELRRSGARPRRAARSGPASLTAGERRIAALAAEGRTNAEIAEALVLAPKTIEGTLARAFRKLGIASRTELAVAWRSIGRRSAVERGPQGCRTVNVTGRRSVAPFELTSVSLPRSRSRPTRKRLPAFVSRSFSFDVAPGAIAYLPWARAARVLSRMSFGTRSETSAVPAHVLVDSQTSSRVRIRPST